jgi:polyhydroxybutyrate depolymerase
MEFPDNFNTDPTRLRPLVMSLHGYSSTGAGTKTYLGLDTLRNADNGYFYIYPDGKADAISGFRYWNASTSCCDDNGENPDDTTYLITIINDIIAAGWPVDTSRILVYGVSNGGLMTERLANQFETRVTHAVSFQGSAAAVGDPAFALSQPVHFMALKCTADTTIIYTGGPIPFLTMADVVKTEGAGGQLEQWRGVLGAGAQGSNLGNSDFFTTTGGAETEKYEYASPPVNGSLTFYKSIGPNHVDPLTAFAGNPTKAFSREVLNWLIARPRV